MCLYNNEINKSIIAGDFPKKKLMSSAINSIEPLDIAKLAEKGMKLLRDHPGLSTVLISIFKNRVVEIDLLNNREIYQKEANILMNTKYDPEMIFPLLQLHREARTLLPFVTTVDKVFWYGAWAYYFSNTIDSLKSEAVCMIYTWVYLLDIIEKKELECGITIDVDRCISNNLEIVDLILGNWDNSKTGLFISLNDEEKHRLEVLFEKKHTLVSKIQDTIAQEKTIASKTEDDWNKFLNLINDLSENEMNTINMIIDTAAPKEKITIINRYHSKLSEVERGRYYIQNQEYSLLSVFRAVIERFNKAPHYCCACTEEQPTFILNEVIAALAMNPNTYNNLFITFHQFRLSPNKDVAYEFFSSALTAIHKNLGINQDEKKGSLDEIIEQFYLAVSSFINENKSIIEELEFSDIQDNTISIKDVSVNYYSTDLEMESMKKLVRNIEQSKNYDEMLEESIVSHLSLDQINALAEQANKTPSIDEKKALARQIVISLNIIYIFCDALRISLNNKHAMVKIKNKDEADKYRRELLKIDTWIVNRVYSGADVLGYREQCGVDSRNLTDSEQAEEKYINSLFADTLKDTLLDLTKGIENSSIEQIFIKKSQIKDTILSLPDCDEKDQYADWIDELSNHLCRVLVEKTQKSQDDYSEVKNNLLTSLGERAAILPDDTVDSLTTAEILYHRYASEKYANKGFDYSSISALYYQAFEAAYNKLIWADYSNILNSVEFNNETYIKTVIKKKSYETFPNETVFHQYLGTNLNEIKKYILFKNEKMGIMETSFTPYCMYGPFSKIMKNLNTGVLGTGFRDYFIKICGFNSSDEMVNDNTFMNMCDTFASNIDDAKDNRNKASHGGAYISMNQCTEDKKTVLDNLETIRSDSMGLIEQLIRIMTYKKN